MTKPENYQNKLQTDQDEGSQSEYYNNIFDLMSHFSVNKVIEAGPIVAFGALTLGLALIPFGFTVACTCCSIALTMGSIGISFIGNAVMVAPIAAMVVAACYIYDSGSEWSASSVDESDDSSLELTDPLDTGSELEADFVDNQSVEM